MANRGTRLAVAILSVTLIGAVIVGGVALAQTPTPTAPNTVAGSWIGLSLADLNAQAAKRLGVDQTAGVAVVNVAQNGPAAQAGVQAKDLITALDGKPITKSEEVVAAVKSKSIGQVVELTVNRAGQSMSFKITTAQAAAPLSAKDRGAPNLPGERFGFGAPFGGMTGPGTLQQFGNFLGSQFKFLDKDNNTVTVRTIPGIVVSAAKDSITIKPNDSSERGGPYAITSDTRVMVRGKNGVESLAAGDQVVITTSDGKNALTISLVSAPPALNDFGPGTGKGNGQRGNGNFNRTVPPKPAPTPGSGA